MNEQKPLVSVVIPTYNEEKDIGDCIESLEKQSYKKTEIIIVDDGSTDKTTKIIKKYKKVKLLRQEHKGPGEARNFGTRKAKGEILILVDSDMTFDKDYVKNLVEPIINDKTGKIIGTTHSVEIVRNLENIWSRCWGEKKVTEEDIKNPKIFRAIKKKNFLEMKGFDSKYGYADDQTFLFKYKIKPKIAEKAVCYHKNPETLKEVYKQSRWLGSSTLMKWINVPVINLIFILDLYLFSPVILPILSLRQVYKIKKPYLLFPYMLIFMTSRWFGTLAGYIRRSLLGINVR